MKTVILFFAVFALSNCEEDGAIQFVIVDEFETNAKVTGLKGVTTFNVTNTTDISDLLDWVDKFVDAEVEKVTLTLGDDHSTGVLAGTFVVKVGNKTLISFIGVLQKGQPKVIDVPSNAANILSVIQNKNLPFNFSAVLVNPGVDDDFTVNLKFKIKGTVE